jgi:hypothetical protein
MSKKSERQKIDEARHYESCKYNAERVLVDVRIECEKKYGYADDYII